jgi:hypothetical protein
MYTAALLDYAFLEARGVLEVVDGDIQVVGDLSTVAVTAVARRPTAHVRGSVVREDTGQPLEDVLVSLGGGPIPDPEQIWGDQDPTWAFPDNVVLTDADGLFYFANVPEHTDFHPFHYLVGYSKPGFIPLDAGITVSIGAGGHSYWVDADPDDLNPATPLSMMPDP